MLISRKAVALLSSGCLVGALLAACSSNNTTPNAVGVVGIVPSQCRTPTEGCACSTEGQKAACGEKVQSERGGLICKTGSRTCQLGTWGACDTSPLTQSKGTVFANLSPMALGNAGTCSDPCNPQCSSFQDNTTGLDAGTGFTVADGGVQLQAAGVCATRFKGQIFDPGDNVPLPNVYVFLKEGAMSALPQGAAQDSCNTILTGGAGGGLPGVRVQSALDGSFDLALPGSILNGTPVDVVVQTGRWRKTLHLTANCGTNNLNHVRLPQTQNVDNEIPQFAVVTAYSDTLECFLAKVGIATSEFTHPSQAGRVHVYQGCGSNSGDPCGPQLAVGNGGPVPEKGAAGSLLASQAELDKHAIVVLPCEGGMRSDSPTYYPTDPQVNRVKAFADAGGRIFATHLSDKYLWHQADVGGAAQDIYPNTVNWKTDDNMFTNSGSTGSQQGVVNTTPPRAQGFFDWIASPTVNGLTSGRVQFDEGRRRAISPKAQGNTWLTNYNPFAIPFYNYTHHITFDTPVGSPTPSGRVVYLSSHVGPVSDRRSGGGTFPSECNLGPALSGSEKALEYMLFDLSSCVGAPPPAPAPVYTAATYTRDFLAQCPVGTRVRWRQFSADVDTPSDSSIQFRAQTADSVALVAAATSFNVHLAQGATPDTPVGGVMLDSDQGGAMTPPTKSSRVVLRISADFTPATGGLLSPALYTWSQNYDCEASE